MFFAKVLKIQVDNEILSFISLKVISSHEILISYLPKYLL